MKTGNFRRYFSGHIKKNHFHLNAEWMVEKRNKSISESTVNSSKWKLDRVVTVSDFCEQKYQ